MSKRSNNAAFSAALEKQLARHSKRKIDLANGVGVSAAYISKLANCAATPSPSWVNTIAAGTTASPQERYQLHAAAAQSAGYDVMPTIEQLQARVAELEQLLKEKN